MKEDFNILIVDDEEDYCHVLAMILEVEGYQVKQCTKSKNVAELLGKEEFDLVISDLIMPEMDGIALLRQVKKIKPDIYFIILTAYGTIENAVEGMRQGAYTYVTKGSDPENLITEIETLTKLKKAKQKQEEHNENHHFLLTTQSSSFQHSLSIAEKAARSDANILILGESGAGKEVIAQYIHQKSKRNAFGFWATNCHTFADSLLESELFGHEKGAFTGAVTKRIGRFEAANEGTLFLDEIGDIPLATQAKLLRAIETKKINRIGNNEEIKVDFRLISATNKDLTKEIKGGSFREDLFYRLSTIIVQVPPLRQRKEDLPEFIDFFLRKAQLSLGLEEIEIHPEVMNTLLNYHYPGNIRELKNMIERLTVLSDHGKITAESVTHLMLSPSPSGWDGFVGGEYSLKELRNEVESKYIEELLKKNKYNITKTAKELEISTRHLFNKISAYGIKDHSAKGAAKDEE